MFPGDTVATCRTCNAPGKVPGHGHKPVHPDFVDIAAMLREQGFKFVGGDWFCADHKAKAEARVGRRPEERARKRIERNKAQKTFIREEETA